MDKHLGRLLRESTTPLHSVAADPADEESDTDTERLTEYRNAQRLVRLHGEDLRYSAAMGWLIWTGTRWEQDDMGEVMRRAKATVRTWYAEILADPDLRRHAKVVKHVLKSESEPSLRHMIALAESEPGIPIRPSALNSNPWLLNVQNGTVDLRTGQLHPHRREDLITKVAPVCYDPHATCPTFELFLRQIFADDPELIRYIQKSAGYAATGDTREDAFQINHGGGRNGKTTLVEVLRATLGDYAQHTSTETILQKKKDGIPNDLAALAGARFVFADESEAGRRLAEGLLKQLTGQNTVSARFLYREGFQFQPVLKLWLSTNHRPRIVESTRAMWARIRLVPFVVTFVDETEPEFAQASTLPGAHIMKKEKALKEKLLAELPGILRWIVEGCRLWLEEGLNPPTIIKEATKAYREDMDTLADFFAECCVREADAAITPTELYKRYVRWAEDSGNEPVKQNVFGMMLHERGFQDKRSHSGRAWLGIRLRTPMDHSPEEPVHVPPSRDADQAGDEPPEVFDFTT